MFQVIVYTPVGTFTSRTYNEQETDEQQVKNMSALLGRMAHLENLGEFSMELENVPGNPVENILVLPQELLRRSAFVIKK